MERDLKPADLGQPSHFVDEESTSRMVMSILLVVM